MRISSLLAVGVVLAFSPVVLAEVIHLKDGTTLYGEVKRAQDGWYVTDARGKVVHVTTDSVQSIELGPRGGADAKDQGMSKLASLRRSVEALGDLKVIIDRYEKFIEQNKDAPVAAEARKDQAQWRDRLAKGMVKVGANWVTPEERGALQVKALLGVDQARELMKQNRLRDADAAVTHALEVDPTNASALYLKGLILYRQDQIQPARKAFEAVREVMPDHGPTLNNLAVVLWRQNQQMAAIAVYHQAMQAMPLNKQLLDNVAEALNALPEEQRKSPVAQKAYKLWTEQDAQLQQRMMSEGWYRWGSTWVDKSQYDKLQVAEKDVKDKIAKLEADFADAQAKIDTIDAQLQQNRQAMQYMEQQRVSVQQDATGRSRAAIYPLPPQYWDYDRANRRLEVQRKETVAALDAMRAKAQAVKQQVPVPKFSGAQGLIGVEGTPAVAPAAVSPSAAKADGPAAAAEAGGETTTPAAPKPVAEGPKAAGDAPGVKPEAPKGEKPLKY